MSEIIASYLANAEEIVLGLTVGSWTNLQAIDAILEGKSLTEGAQDVLSPKVSIKEGVGKMFTPVPTRLREESKILHRPFEDFFDCMKAIQNQLEVLR